MARLILCADDGVQKPDPRMFAVALAQAGKINAISCMAACEGWAGDSALLRELPAHVEIGLHLTLTEEAPLTAMPRFAPQGRMPAINPLGRLARQGKLPLDEIAAEIRAQFDAFRKHTGRAPDFVDGHQHAHALPGIRAIMLAETAHQAPQAWIRCCMDQLSAIAARPFKGKAIGSALHSIGLRRAAAEHGLRTNSSFAGHYGFAGDYAAMFPRFLAKPGDVHLIMCHPGAGVRDDDTIAQAREVEADALRRLPIADIARSYGLAFAA